jgi:hypothetical protein
MMSFRLQKPVRIIGAALVIALVTPGVSHAQNILGAHFGFLFPLVTRAGDETTTIGDQFTIGFPTGITVKTSEKWAFDVEFVPTIQRTPYAVGLTFHPGIIYTLPANYAAGIRLAFDVNQASWGFTPLLNKKLRQYGDTILFGELVVPLRFQDQNNSIGIGVHVGLSF